MKNRPSRSAGQRLPCYAPPLERLSDVDDALEHLGAIRALAPKLLLLRHEARRDAGGDLAPLARLLKETGADLELQAILVAASDGEADEELASLAKRLSGEGIAVSRVSAFAKVDEQSFQPGESRLRAAGRHPRAARGRFDLLHQLTRRQVTQ